MPGCWLPPRPRPPGACAPGGCAPAGGAPGGCAAGGASGSGSPGITPRQLAYSVRPSKNSPWQVLSLSETIFSDSKMPSPLPSSRTRGELPLPDALCETTGRPRLSKVTTISDSVLSSGVTRSILNPGSSANGDPGGNGWSWARSDEGRAGCCRESINAALSRSYGAMNMAMAARPIARFRTRHAFMGASGVRVRSERGRACGSDPTGPCPRRLVAQAFRPACRGAGQPYAYARLRRVRRASAKAEGLRYESTSPSERKPGAELDAPGALRRARQLPEVGVGLRARDVVETARSCRRRSTDPCRTRCRARPGAAGDVIRRSGRS